MTPSTRMAPPTRSGPVSERLPEGRPRSLDDLGRHLLGTGGVQNGLPLRLAILVRVHAHQDAPTLDLVVIEARFVLRNTETDECSGEAASRRARAESRQSRDDRARR